MFQASTPEEQKRDAVDYQDFLETLQVELGELGDRIADSSHDPNRTYSVSAPSGIGSF